MRAGDIRKLSIEEVNQKLTDYEEELFNLKFQHETSQLENTCSIKNTKRIIARINTVKNEINNNRNTE